MAKCDFESILGFLPEAKTLQEAYEEKYPSQCKAWQRFADAAATSPGFQKPYAPDAFFKYGQLLVELGYATAPAYLMHAYNWCDAGDGYLQPSKNWDRPS